jgi:hypothetical protein
MRPFRREQNQPVGSSVEYRGRCFAPAPNTYSSVDVKLNPWSLSDSGPAGRDARAFLPLIAAALYEAAFAYEAGPLSTWAN